MRHTSMVTGTKPRMHSAMGARLIGTAMTRMPYRLTQTGRHAWQSTRTQPFLAWSDTPRIGVVQGHTTVVLEHKDPLRHPTHTVTHTPVT